MPIKFLNEGDVDGVFQVKINSSTSTVLKLYNNSNGSGAAIEMSDQTGQAQKGYMTFRHSDSASQGGGASFHFTSEPDTVLVIGDSTNKGRFAAWSANNAAEVDYGFANDTNTGMYSPAAGQTGLVSDGSRKLLVNGSGVTIQNGRLYLDTVDTNTSSTTALVLNGTEVEKRTLGSAAFSATGDFAAASHTHSYLPLSGGTMTGNIVFSDDGEGVEFYGTNSLKKVNGTGMVLEVDSTRTNDLVLQVKRGTDYYHMWHSGHFTSTNVSNWNTAYGWGNHASAGYLTSVPSPQVGDWWNNGFVKVGADGVMEVGKYMDWHSSDAGTTDYDYRMWVNSGTMTFSGDALFQGGDVWITKQNDAPTLTLLHDGTNPSTNDLLFKMQFQSDYDGTHQNWGKIELDTNSSSVRTNMDFYVKSASGAEQLGFRIEGQPSETPKAYFYNDVAVTGDVTASNLNVSNWNTAYGWGDHAGLYQAAGNYFTDGDTVLNMANNDGLEYNDTNNLMYIKADGTNYAIIDSRGGTIQNGTLTFGTSAHIAMSNGNITGVNQIEINDPGEGIVWTSGSSGNITLAVTDDASDNILNLSGTGATLAINGTTIKSAAFQESSAFAAASHNHDGRYIRRYEGTAVLTDTSTYVRALRVTGDRLGSSVRVAINGTSANVVIHTVADILCNHSQDIVVKSISGNYTQVYLQVISDNNENFDLYIKGTGSVSNTTVSVDVVTSNDETVTFNPTATAYSGTTHEHLTVAGEKITASDNGAGDLTVDDVIYASGGNSTNWNTAYGWGDHSTQGYLTSSSTQSKYLRSDADDTATGLLTLNGGVQILAGTGGGQFRLKRNAASATGDDVFDMHLDDGNIYFDIDNDNDGDSSGFAFRYATGGSFSNLLNFSSSSFSYKGATIWTSGNDGTGSGLDADLLDGQEGTYYLDYNNFTNTPSIPVSGTDFDPAGTDNSTDVTLNTNSYDYLSLSGQEITLGAIDYNSDITNLPTLFDGAYNSLTGIPSTFPPAAHTHDDRYYTESEMKTYFKRGYIESQSATNLAVGWYTIAQNTGDRALGEFQIWDTNSSRHQSVIFNAAHHFGTDDSNSITVLANSSFGTDVFRYIRIKENGTYDGAAIQVYIDNSTNIVGCAIIGGNAQTGGWSLVDWLADATAPSQISNWSTATEKSKVDLDNIHAGGIATTGKIYAGGATTQYRVLTTDDEGAGNGLDADTLDGNHASAFALASHTHSYLPLSGGTLTGELVLDYTNPAMVFKGDDGIWYRLKVDESGNQLELGHTTNIGLKLSNAGGVTFPQLGAGLLQTNASGVVSVDTNTYLTEETYSTASELLTAIKTVDGSGTGLDADTVDGIHASSFVRSDANDTISSTLTFTGSIGFSNNHMNKAFISVTSGSGLQKYKIFDNTSTVDGYGAFKIHRAYDYGDNDQTIQEIVFQRRGTTNNTVKYKQESDITATGDVYIEFYKQTDNTYEAWLCVSDYGLVGVEINYKASESSVFTSPSSGTPAGTLVYSTDPDVNAPNWQLDIGKLRINETATAASETTAVVLDSNKYLATRELGSNAFTSTTIPTGNAVIDWTVSQTENIHADNYTDTQYSEFGGDAAGLVPAGDSYDATYYLDGDGNWSIPPDNNTVTSVGITGDHSTGTITLVAGGATNINKSGGTITIDSTDSQYTAGAGLDLTSGTFSVEPDLRDGITHIGRDTNDFLAINTTNFAFYLDGTLDMRLSNGGTLDVDGDVVAYSTVTNSDRRLKTDISTIENASEKVSKLRGVEYTWDHGKRKGQRDIGLIAQEVEEVIPEVVSEGELLDGTTAKRVDYAKLVGLLIESNKELQERIKELEDRLDGFTK